MKGIIFTEFFELVESEFGFPMVDAIIDESLPSGGVYTAIDTYDHSEIVHLLKRLSSESDIPIDELLVIFGKHLFRTFASQYKEFFVETKTAFQMLSSVENYIHVEVKKLYPDAQLPKFTISQSSEREMEMLYQSDRSMGKLAYGLIQGCLDHFHFDATIDMENVTDNGTVVHFKITQNG